MENYQIVFCAGAWRNAQVHSGESSIGTNGLPKANCELGQHCNDKGNSFPWPRLLTMSHHGEVFCRRSSENVVF